MVAADAQDPALVAFWTERHLCSLTTLRADGSPHVVAVGATFDPQAMMARIITSDGTVKVRNVDRSPGHARVAICQIDGRRWSTLEGTARVSRNPEDIAESVHRYAQRYRQPRVNPARVTILVSVHRVLGHG